MKKNFLTWCIIILLISGLYSLFQDNMNIGSYSNYAFSDFLSKIEEGQVQSVTIQGNYIEGKFNDGSSFTTYSPEYPNLIDKLKQNSVRIEAMPTSSKGNSFINILISWFPIILLVGVWIFFMRQMQNGSGKAMGFGKSRAKLMKDTGKKVTFADVAGISEAKEELVEIVDFLKDPQKFQKLGAKIPKGCLLVGHPGTGKTLLAKAIAGEANVPFFSISGSDFVEMFVGVGASRVRDMFEQGKKNAPCIIFIDEIDAVGRHRGIGLGGGNDEREQTLNQLLVELDGFETNEGIIIVAATNRPDVLDPALLRPGRIDRQIEVPLADAKGREEIFKVHLNNVKYANDVNPKILAMRTPGFSGADIANIVNEGAINAAKKNKRLVTMRDLEEGADKVMMGAERKSMVMRDEEKKLTAYHEGGHALVAINSPASDPVHKATIIPRGRALGMVMRLPEYDRISVTREKLEADLAVTMGGRVAEELIFGYDKVTSGASSDIKSATKIARSMVTEWGMSDEIGPIFYGGEQNDAYLGGASSQKNKSGDVSNLIEKEVKRIVESAYNRAKKILSDNLSQLHILADALLKYETLTGEEIRKILAGEDINNDDSDTKPNARKSSLGGIDFGIGSGPQEA